MSIELNPLIRFEDQHLCVLSKPAGLLSQDDASGEASLVTWARGHFGRNYVGLVHRLDRNTSGLMVLAKRTKSAERLTTDLQKGEVQRAYLAWCTGKTPAQMDWTHWILKDEKNNQSVAYRTKPGGSVKKNSQFKEARLQGASLYYSKTLDASLCRFQLETGRSHQIRAQTQAEGHPLLGDRKYGKEKAPIFPRPALHSYYLKFSHPMSRDVLEFTEPLPSDLIPASLKGDPQWRSLDLKNPPL